MRKLAILGHLTRGKEVIEILEMLGGKKEFVVNGNTSSKYRYYIDSDKMINVFTVGNEDLKYEYITFTLEEFLKKFPYKIGDRVRVPEYESEVRISKMYWDGNEVQYEVVTDEVEWYSASELNKFNEPNKEAPRYLNEKANKQAKEIEKLLEPAKEIIEGIIKIDIPKGYEFARVDNQQIVFEKICCQYPKTYDECCDIFNCTVESLSLETIKNFRHLIYCRNAYWKIAGEQMGLGKPWEPDWGNVDDHKYVICRLYTGIVTEVTGGWPRILAFPTEEMRDVFYQNFKDLIEQCKELL